MVVQFSSPSLLRTIVYNTSELIFFLMQKTFKKAFIEFGIILHLFHV